MGGSLRPVMGAVLLLASVSYGCPVDTPCNCSPRHGVARFLTQCVPVTGDANLCVDAATSASLRLGKAFPLQPTPSSWLRDIFYLCDASAASSCFPVAVPVNLTQLVLVTLCTGRAYRNGDVFAAAGFVTVLACPVLYTLGVWLGAVVRHAWLRIRHSACCNRFYRAGFHSVPSTEL